MEAVELSSALEYAVSRVNNNRTLRINTNRTIGYMLIDTCGLVDRTVKAFISIIPSKVVAVIGVFSSVELTSIRSLINVYKIPTFTLTEHEQGPQDESYLFSTTPSTFLEITGLLELSKYYGWENVNIICEEDEVSRREYIASRTGGLCETNTVYIKPNQELSVSLSTVKDGSVVLIFGGPQTVKDIIDIFYLNSFTGMVLFGTSRWVHDPEITGRVFERNLGDVLGLKRHTFPSLGLSNMVPFKDYKSPYRIRYLSYVFHCLGEPEGPCKHKKLNRSYKESGKVRPLVDIVWAIANSVSHTTNENKHLATVMRTRTFKSYSGRYFKVSVHGLSYQNYDVYQLSVTGILKVIGTWNPSSNTPLKFKNVVTWLSTMGTVTPSNQCDVKICDTGEYRIEHSKCCWGCKKCPENSAGNGTDCVTCELGQITVGSKCVTVLPVFIDTSATKYCAAVFSVQMLILLLVCCVREYITADISRDPKLSHPEATAETTIEFDRSSSRWIISLSLLGTVLAFLFVTQPTPTNCTTHILCRTFKTLMLSIILNHASSSTRSTPRVLGTPKEDNKMWRICVAIIIIFLKITVEVLIFFTQVPYVQIIALEREVQMVCRADFGIFPMFSEMFTMCLVVLSIIMFTREMIYIRYLQMLGLNTTHVQSATTHVRPSLVTWYFWGLSLHFLSQVLAVVIIIGTPTPIKSIWLSLVTCLGQLILCLMLFMPQIYYRMVPYCYQGNCPKHFSNFTDSPNSSDKDPCLRTTPFCNEAEVGGSTKDPIFLLQLSNVNNMSDSDKMSYSEKMSFSGRKFDEISDTVTNDLSESTEMLAEYRDDSNSSETLTRLNRFDEYFSDTLTVDIPPKMSDSIVVIVRDDIEENNHNVNDIDEVSESESVDIMVNGLSLVDKKDEKEGSGHHHGDGRHGDDRHDDGRHGDSRHGDEAGDDFLKLCYLEDS